MSGDNKATVACLLGLFALVGVVAWSLAWYNDSKNSQRRPTVANVVVVCQDSTDVEFICKVK